MLFMATNITYEGCSFDLALMRLHNIYQTPVNSWLFHGKGILKNDMKVHSFKSYLKFKQLHLLLCLKLKTEASFETRVYIKGRMLALMNLCQFE